MGDLLGVIVAVPAAVVIKKSILVTLRLLHTPPADAQGIESPVAIAEANRVEGRRETPVS